MVLNMICFCYTGRFNRNRIASDREGIRYYYRICQNHIALCRNGNIGCRYIIEPPTNLLINKFVQAIQRGRNIGSIGINHIQMRIRLIFSMSVTKNIRDPKASQGIAMVGQLDIIGHTLPRQHKTITTTADFFLNHIGISQSGLPSRNTVLKCSGIMVLRYFIDIIIGNCPLIHLKANIGNGDFRIGSSCFGRATMADRSSILCNGLFNSRIQRTSQCHLNGFIGLHIAHIIDRKHTAIVGVMSGFGTLQRYLLQDQALRQSIRKHQRISFREASTIPGVIAVAQIICYRTTPTHTGRAFRFGKSTIAKVERVLVYGYRCILRHAIGCCRCGIDDIATCAVVRRYLYRINLGFTNAQINASARQIRGNHSHLARICKYIRNRHITNR